VTKEQRTAIALIISDIIKGDNIIEESEIRDMKRLMSEYSITHQNMSDARKIRFSDVVNMLRSCQFGNERHSLITFIALYGVVLSTCREVLLLIALQYCLIEADKKFEGNTSLPKPYLISSHALRTKSG